MATKCNTCGRKFSSITARNVSGTSNQVYCPSCGAAAISGLS